MVYKFRLISNEQEEFIRDFEVRSSQTFYDLHMAIQEDLHYDKSQIASFFLCAENWEKMQEITLFDLSEEPSNQVLVMDNTRFEDHITELKQKLIYVYDVFNERSFFIEVAEIRQDDQQQNYPVCSFSKGCPPQQILMDQIFFDKISDNADDLRIEYLDGFPQDGMLDDSDFGYGLFDDMLEDEE